MSTSSACAKNSRTFFIPLLCLWLSVAPSAAGAQEPPPQEDMPAAAGVAVPTEEAPADSAPTTSLADLPAPTAKLDPCPVPSAEMAQAPDDLAKIQSDIDRYTLCMERAQLLQRLNDVAMENQEKLDAANGVIPAGLSATNPGMQLGSNTMPSFEEQRAQLMGSVNETAVDGQAPAATAPVDDGGWYIVKVMGSGANLFAQIGKKDGTLARVKTGDTLPDGSTVDMVSATSVSITQDGEQKVLAWRDDSASAEQTGL